MKEVLNDETNKRQHLLFEAVTHLFFSLRWSAVQDCRSRKQNRKEERSVTTILNFYRACTLITCDIWQENTLYTSLSLFPSSSALLSYLRSFLLITNFPGTCRSNLFSLPLSSSSNILASQVSSFLYYCIPLFWHSGSKNTQTSLFVSFSHLSFLLLHSFLSLFWVGASSNEQSSSSPGQSKQNQSHIPRAQFAVTSQLCELGVFELEVWRSSWVASGC